MCSDLLQHDLRLHTRFPAIPSSRTSAHFFLHCSPGCEAWSLLLAGLASEEALLDWPALALRCGRPEAAVAAAQRAAAALPQVPALQQQLLVLQAQRCTMQVPPSCMAN